jgi:hypothetical protein
VSIPITSDHFCVSADEPAVRLQLLARLLEQLTDTVITVATAARPDGVTVTVLAREPHHQPWHLYGAAFIDGTQEPDVAMPVIPLDAITHIHVCDRMPARANVVGPTRSPLHAERRPRRPRTLRRLLCPAGHDRAGQRRRRRRPILIDHLSPGPVDDQVGVVDVDAGEADPVDRHGHLAEHDDVADRHRRAQLTVGTVVAVVASEHLLGEDLEARHRVRRRDDVAPTPHQPVTALVGP